MASDGEEDDEVAALASQLFHDSGGVEARPPAAAAPPVAASAPNGAAAAQAERGRSERTRGGGAAAASSEGAPATASAPDLDSNAAWDDVLDILSSPTTLHGAAASGAAAAASAAPAAAASLPAASTATLTRRKRPRHVPADGVAPPKRPRQRAAASPAAAGASAAEGAGPAADAGAASAAVATAPAPSTVAAAATSAVAVAAETPTAATTTASSAVAAVATAATPPTAQAAPSAVAATLPTPAAGLIRHRASREAQRAGHASEGVGAGSSEEARIAAALRGTALVHSLCPVDEVARTAKLPLPAALRLLTLDRLWSAGGQGGVARGAIVRRRSRPCEEDPPGENHASARKRPRGAVGAPAHPAGAEDDREGAGSEPDGAGAAAESGPVSGAWQVSGPLRSVEQAWQRVALLTCKGDLGRWATMEACTRGARLAVQVDSVMEPGRALRVAVALRNALCDAGVTTLGRRRLVLWSLHAGATASASAVWEHRAKQPHVLEPRQRGLQRAVLPGAAGEGPFSWQPRQLPATAADGGGGGGARVQDPT